MLDMLNLNAGGVLTPDFMLMLDSKDIPATSVIG